MSNIDEKLASIPTIPLLAERMTKEQPSCENDPKIAGCSDDTISRQAAIDALDCINGVEEVLRSLPSAEPTITLEQAIDYLHETGWLQNHDRILTESKIVPPPRGEWIDTETSYADGVRQECRCSVCARLSPRPLGDFCRWCGADMRGEAE